MLEITDVRVDGFSEFLGVDEKTTLSWKFTGEGEDAFQKSCRIRVKDAQGRISDTGEMETERHQGMPFPDMEWRSFTEYQVQVEGKDCGGNLTESGWITFVTGALVPEDFQGQWIGTGEGKPFYARKRWNLAKKVKSAYALVCGLGQFRFYINGKKVSDHELDPGWTNYGRKVQYVMFDIAPYLREGENVFGVSVGNGFYLGDKGGRYFFEMPPEAMKRFMPPNTNGYRPFGDALPLKGMFLLRYADGSSDVICTDSSWKVRRSACQLANVYGSEIYDARNDPAGWNDVFFDDGTWAPAVKVEGPKGRLTAQGQPPIVVKKVCEAKLIARQEDGDLYDLGQNMSCILEISVKGKRGDRVELLPAEKLDERGKIDQMAKNWNMIDVSCTYILSGDPEGETWRQEFSYVGGRYVLVKGAAPAEEAAFADGADTADGGPAAEGSGTTLLALRGYYIVSDSPVTGSFWCDDRRYNQVYDLIAEAMDSNLKSVHTDCPTIEKTAWLEESHLLAPSLMFYRDVRDLWRKIFCDAATDQYSADTAENRLDGKPFFRGAGFLPPIAPSYGKFIADTPLGNFWDLIAWGSFLILGAKWFYEYYGDLSMIRNYYGANCAYMDYLRTKITEDGFIAHGLGDWGNPQAGAQATANVETAFYYEDLVTMAEFAGLLGKQEDEKRFKDLAEEVRGNYNEKLLVKDPAGRWCYRAWDHGEEMFCTQACQALPLHFGMVPEDKEKDVTDTLLELLEPSGFVSGEIGFPAILRCLQESGHGDLIWKLAMREDTFSFYHFVQTGETALGEYWEDNPRSHNHDMMGSLMECYYTGIAGIRGLEPGFARAEIRPRLPKGMKRMKCSYDSAQGVVALEVDTAGADAAGPEMDAVGADAAGTDGREVTASGGVTVSVVIPAGMEAELDLTALGLDVREHLIPGRYRFAPR